eukprot:TRINITY_DN2722_c0_g1_i1.p1 TRINITY_DN2722_c0_g1~~TRINITY_DN2722_c0_g1_i1.p1  ORF type:complete len:1038 (+),score=253.59 TRINITY_DN2722_c0_g1_i1:123-3236(+)
MDAISDSSSLPPAPDGEGFGAVEIDEEDYVPADLLSEGVSFVYSYECDRESFTDEAVADDVSAPTHVGLNTACGELTHSAAAGVSAALSSVGSPDPAATEVASVVSPSVLMDVGAHNPAGADAAGHEPSSPVQSDPLNNACGEFSPVPSQAAASPPVSSVASPMGTLSGDAAGRAQGAAASDGSAVTDPLNRACGEFSPVPSQSAGSPPMSSVASPVGTLSGAAASGARGAAEAALESARSSFACDQPPDAPAPISSEAAGDMDEDEAETAVLRAKYAVDSWASVVATGQIGKVTGVARGRVGIWANGAVRGFLPAHIEPVADLPKDTAEPQPTAPAEGSEDDDGGESDAARVRAAFPVGTPIRLVQLRSRVGVVTGAHRGRVGVRLANGHVVGMLPCELERTEAAVDESGEEAIQAGEEADERAQVPLADERAQVPLVAEAPAAATARPAARLVSSKELALISKIALRDVSIKPDSLQVTRSVDLVAFARMARRRAQGGGLDDDSPASPGGELPNNGEKMSKLSNTIRMLSVNVPQGAAGTRNGAPQMKVDSPRSALVLFRNGIGVDALTLRVGASEAEVLNAQLLLSALRKEYERICAEVSIDDFINAAMGLCRTPAASPALTPSMPPSGAPSPTHPPPDVEEELQATPPPCAPENHSPTRGRKPLAPPAPGLGRVEENRLQHLRDGIQQIQDTALRMNQKELAQVQRMRTLREEQDKRFDRKRHRRDEALSRRDAARERARLGHEAKYASVMKKSTGIHEQVNELRQRMAERQRERGAQRLQVQQEAHAFLRSVGEEQEASIASQARDAQMRQWQRSMADLVKLDTRHRENIETAYEREVALLKSMHMTERQKVQFMEKQLRDRDRLGEFYSSKHEERRFRSQLHSQLEGTRTQKYLNNCDAILARSRMVQQKQQEKDQRLLAQITRVEQRRAEAHRANILAGQQRTAHVRRTQQQQEYHRLVTMQTIYEKSERVEELARQRAQAMAQHNEEAFQKKLQAKAMIDALKREEHKALQDGFRRVQDVQKQAEAEKA